MTKTAVVPEDREDILTKRSSAHVATIGPHGEPQSNPVWFEWDGEYIKFSQTTTRQKYRNLKRDSRIALSVHDPDEPHRYIEIRGRAEKIEPDPNRSFINKMSKKYLGQETYPPESPGEERVVVYVRPEHTTKQ